ncbi:cobalt ECF transporter T component CbiQ [Thermosynechococcus vestitus]|uniref:Permease protein of cobalt ABC transporter n=1 Tax=Thermosynechococcus vestitus (strain NIES-2133 / IAM M-273 / BP-1) TaxID=197221 RepID=Q8DG83_THEVB|nr:cobalt ECF transporter T component CbiQ [Thermosynechococcus vestitus]BAC09992.1 permease protein of cobalt ABC transporter [Thermosynechococcus vestitus BP-1]
MHHHLDTYAYTNGLRHLHPEQKLIFAIASLLFTFFARPLIQGLLWLWLSLWILGYARIPWRVYCTLLATVAVFWLVSLPGLVVQIIPTEALRASGQGVLSDISLMGWSLFVSAEKLHQGLTVGLRTMVASTCLLLILLTTPFPELLVVAERWGVPTFVLDVLMLMYRYIFTLLETAFTLQLAQRARGGYQQRSRWLFSVGLLAAQLLQQSLHRYQAIQLALVSRGFQGQFRVLRPCTYTYSQRYGLEVLIGGSALLLLNTLMA